MLNHKGKQVEQLAIWFVDGLAITAEPDPDELVVERAVRCPMHYDWFDIFVLVQDNEPARLWKADIIAPSFKDEYITRMVADFWCGNTTNTPYWKSWWVETTTGDKYNHEFTGQHQSDAADHFNRTHPGVQIASVSGKDRVYLDAIARQSVESDPFSANQTLSTLLQFEHLC